MKIAIPYENGQVFQHFGRTQTFKIYNVEGKEILSSEIIDSNGAGHGALASVLSNEKVDVLICGGIGMGAINALGQEGIEVCSGASGDVDLVVKSYLRGVLITVEGTCDHHHHEEGHSCGDHGCH